MYGPEVIEKALAAEFKGRGYRKRGRNWFRTTGAGEYQVVNLQRSQWGGGHCYLNLGWDYSPPPNTFQPENLCTMRLRAEEADVIPTIQRLRADRVSSIELDGISLLDPQLYSQMNEEVLVEEVTTVLAAPIADFLDRTPAVTDLVPLLRSKPWLATLRLRTYLLAAGHDLPSR